MNEVQLGSVLRRVRLRAGLRQADIAQRAGVSQVTVSRIEHGLIRNLQLGTVVRVLAALEMSLDLIPRWRGGDLPRLLTAAHSRLHEVTARMLRRHPGWRFVPEVSFSIYGERGVIDILAFHPATGSVLVIELKSQLVDLEGLIGAVDRYRRLAPRIARERGWAARSVSAWVIFADTSTNRRRVAAHGAVLGAAFPETGRTVRAWLRDPLGKVSGISFLSASPPGTGSRDFGGARRVRARPSSVGKQGNRPPIAAARR